MRVYPSLITAVVFAAAFWGDSLFDVNSFLYGLALASAGFTYSIDA